MGAVSPKGGVVRCYFGVSPKKITVMDEKTKVQNLNGFKLKI